MATQPIAFFITPHGYGHATRSAAVMAAIQTRIRDARFELFTTCPVQLFGDPQQANFGYHRWVTDIGMVQRSPLAEDPDATCRRLDRWLPFDKTLVNQTARELKRLNCALVVSDISPLGIVSAHCAGLPALLVENFTWDWIYHAYLSKAPGLQPHIDYLAAIFSQADHCIQAKPVCRPVAGALQVAPIGRMPRESREQTRRRLKIPDQAKMVLVSMGGVPDTFDFLERLPKKLDFYLVIPGAGNVPSPHKHVIVLPTHTDFFHPDLMQAADVLIGKAGYSTAAEAYHSGTPFGYICRPHFPESAIVETFIAAHLPARAIDPGAYRSGRWINTLPELLSAPRNPFAQENGADTVAAFIEKGFF
jgi:hypothetical protein